MATKHEIVLAIVGGLFVLEALSVIIQVASFKTTGKRVFKMAPVHHHFELKGLAEPKIIVRFWIAAIPAAALVLYLALGVFGVQALFYDVEVNEEFPGGASRAALPLPAQGDQNLQLNMLLTHQSHGSGTALSGDRMGLTDVLRHDSGFAEGHFANRQHR